MPLPLCVRIDADDHRSAEALKQDGWREIEILEVWGNDMSRCSGIVSPMIRSAKPTDNLPCQLIAQKACVFDRLHRDPKVKLTDADAFKREQVNAAFRGPLDDVLVFESGPVSGFVILEMEYIAFSIGLICVDPAHHGKGIGKALIQTAMSLRPHHSKIRAGTQSHNIPARSLYRSCELAVLERLRTFHK
jgi:ribosomal protein S18 acetylase RimI-like enzyme